MQTRKQELAQLDTQIADLRAKLNETTKPALRAKLEAQIAGADTTARQLINERHDHVEAQQAQQQQALAAANAQQEAAQRARLRRVWRGDDASFETAYPRLLEEYRIAAALATADEPLAIVPAVSF